MISVLIGPLQHTAHIFDPFSYLLISAKCGESKTFKDVDCQVGNGENYKGNVNVTRAGRKCQNWSSQSPHSHGWGKEGDHNYCRNPDKEPHAWCYTMEDKRWEFCDIRTCNECDY